MLKEFQQFLLRGNSVDLAVGVVVGASFGSVVTALVKDIITPLIGAIVKTPDFSQLKFTINSSVFMYGDFLNILISFILVSAVVFFFVVKPMNLLLSKFNKAPETTPTTKKCSECLGDIPIKASRCMHCGQPISESK